MAGPTDVYVVVGRPARPGGPPVPVAPVAPPAPPVDPYTVVTRPRVPGAATLGDQVAAKQPDQLQAIADALESGVANLYTGAAKSVGEGLFGLGKLAHDYTPLGRVSDLIQPGAFDQTPPELQRQGAMQRLGGAAEQVAEFAVPVGKVGRVGQAVEATRAALLTKAHGGSATDAGMAATLSAAVPVFGKVASELAPGLRSRAEKTIAQALGATKEKWKDIAEKIAPEILDRGVSGTRAGMLERAKAQVAAIGQRIEQEVATQTAAGATVDGRVLRAAAQAAIDALKVPAATGRKIPILGAETAIQKLRELDAFARTLGPQIPFDKAQLIKQTWQHIVSSAGLYGPKATSTATDNAAADALRKGAAVFKDMLATGSTTLDDLNREFQFWKGLKDVLTATQKRTQAQAVGLSHNMAMAAGAATGAALGGPAGAGLGVVVPPMVIDAMRSPWFRTTVAAPLKNAMATALASGNKAQVQMAAARILAAMPTALRTALTP